MVEASDSFEEEAKRGLLQEVAALRKQSVFALILAVLFILVTVYLYVQLRESQADLKASYARLKVSNDSLQASKKQLEAQNDSITNLKNQLDEFREKYLKENSPYAATYSPNYPNRPRIARQIPPGGEWESCFGYIVYVQDRRGNRVSAAIRQALKDKGAIVPAIEHMGDRMKFESEIRYFHPEDKDMADFMQQLIMKTLNTKNISFPARRLPVTYVQNKKAPLGQLEVWIDR